jgi:hypothetical protein
VSLPQKKSRSIAIGGRKYRWIVYSPDGYPCLVIDDRTKKFVRCYDLETMPAVTPSEVRRVIEVEMAAELKPNLPIEKGPITKRDRALEAVEFHPYGDEIRAYLAAVDDGKPYPSGLWQDYLRSYFPSNTRRPRRNFELPPPSPTGKIEYPRATQWTSIEGPGYLIWASNLTWWVGNHRAVVACKRHCFERAQPVMEELIRGAITIAELRLEPLGEALASWDLMV